MINLIPIHKSEDSVSLRGLDRDCLVSLGSHLERCAWCHSSKGVTRVEFYSICGFNKDTRAYDVHYPGQQEFLVGVVSHLKCSPDIGYAIALDDLEKNLDMWLQHIEEKAWGGRAAREVLYDVMCIHRPRAYRTWKRSTRFQRMSADRRNV